MVYNNITEALTKWVNPKNRAQQLLFPCKLLLYQQIGEFQFMSGKYVNGFEISSYISLISRMKMSRIENVWVAGDKLIVRDFAPIVLHIKPTQVE